MPKYRLLSTEELQQFEKEFVQFLVVNGIEPQKWEKIKEEDKQSVDKIVELFSDVILESVLRKIDFIEIRTASYVQAVQCLPEKMIAIAIQQEKTTQTDNQSSKELNLYKSERFYDGDREAEIFAMLERGYEISDGTLYKKLQLASIN